MRELSLAQKAMLNGSICPYCKNPSTMINTVEGKQVGCEKCGAWMRSICRDGLYSGESVLYSIHSNIGSLIGIRLQDDFWLFAHHEPNLVNAYHIGEFYLREISDRFRKAAFIADFKKKSYSWVQETVGKLYCIALPEGYYPHTVNYLFTIHVACTDLYLLEGYSETSNQPTFFELDI